MEAIMPEPRTLTAAEREDESARMERARVTGAVRREQCSLCGALAYGPCKVRPAADHLQRWLDAYSAGRITKAETGEAISRVVVITRWQLIPERAQ